MIGAALGLAVAAQGAAPTIALAEIEQLADRSALSLAPRLLPPDIAPRVVEARLRRDFLPGEQWSAYFIGSPMVAGKDICERPSYTVRLTASYVPGRPAAATMLAIGPVSEGRESAVLAPGVTASPATCRAARYIYTVAEPQRQIAAYRVLLSAIAAARGGAPLPFAVTCRAETPQPCADTRAALANLPLDVLGGITVSCPDHERRREYLGSRVAIVSCPALRPGQPYKADVGFGRSGDDGQSWLVDFVHRPGWPDTINLRRTLVISH